MRGSSEELGSGRHELGDFHVYVDKGEEREITVGDRQVSVWTISTTTLTGTVDGQEGKQLHYNDYFFRDVLKLAAACGLVDKVTGQVFTEARRVQLEEAAKRKEKVECEFDVNDLIGCSFYCDVVNGKPAKSGKYAGQSFPELGKNIRSLLDPSVAGLPKDPDIWAAVSGAANGQGGANGQHAAAGSLLD